MAQDYLAKYLTSLGRSHLSIDDTGAAPGAAGGACVSLPAVTMSGASQAPWPPAPSLTVLTLPGLPKGLGSVQPS